jgi:hypothetical protein
LKQADFLAEALVESEAAEFLTFQVLCQTSKLAPAVPRVR